MRRRRSTPLDSKCERQPQRPKPWRRRCGDTPQNPGTVRKGPKRAHVGGKAATTTHTTSAGAAVPFGGALDVQPEKASGAVVPRGRGGRTAVFRVEHPRWTQPKEGTKARQWLWELMGRAMQSAAAGQQQQPCPAWQRAEARDLQQATPQQLGMEPSTFDTMDHMDQIGFLPAAREAHRNFAIGHCWRDATAAHQGVREGRHGELLRNRAPPCPHHRGEASQRTQELTRPTTADVLQRHDLLLPASSQRASGRAGITVHASGYGPS